MGLSERCIQIRQSSLLITAHYGTVRWVVWKDGWQNNYQPPIRLINVLV